MKFRSNKDVKLTSSSDEEVEFENSMANVTAQAGLVGAVNRDYERITEFLPFLDGYSVITGLSLALPHQTGFSLLNARERGDYDLWCTGICKLLEFSFLMIIINVFLIKLILVVK